MTVLFKKPGVYRFLVPGTNETRSAMGGGSAWPRVMWIPRARMGKKNRAFVFFTMLILTQVIDYLRYADFHFIITQISAISFLSSNNEMFVIGEAGSGICSQTFDCTFCSLPG